MPDFHPIISSFPLCLLLTIIYFEVISVSKSSPHQLNSTLKLLFFLLGSILLLTFVSGLIAADWTKDLQKQAALESHYNIAKLNLFLFLPVITLFTLKNRHKYLKYAYFAFFLLLLLNLLYTGNLGGLLVFTHGFGQF